MPLIVADSRLTLIQREAIGRSQCYDLRRMKAWFHGGNWLRAMPALTVAIFLVPVIAGLLGTLLPSFGYLPGLGQRSLFA